MKKALALILVLVMVFALAACGNSNSNGSTTTPAPGKTENTGNTGKTESTPAPTPEENIVASGSLGGGITTMDDGWQEITTEGKSTDLKIIVANETDVAATAPFAQGAGRNQTKYLIYDNLAVMHYPGGSVDEMDWVMAKNITKVDNDTYDIEIYDYIHDWAGNAITAEDVVFSYEAYAASGASGKFSSHLGSIEATGDYTVRLVIKDNALGMAQYMLQQCPVVSKVGYESQSEAELAQNPICTGMYKITEFVAGGYVTLTRVDDYWQTDSSLWPYLYSGQLQEVKIIIMTEASQRAIGLENNSIDVVPNVAKEDITNFMNDDGTAKDGYNVLKVLNSTADYMLFNQNEASICSDINIRKAITYAVDRAGIMDGTYGKGGYLPSNDTPTAVVGDYNPEWTWHDMDLDKAKEALAASGKTNVEIKIMCESNNYKKTEAELLQAYLSVIGINCSINAYDSALLNEYKKDPTAWDIMVTNGGSSDYCLDNWNLFLPLKINGTLNSALIADQEAYDLLTAAGGLDTHSAETVDAMHNYLLDNFYVIPLGTYYKYSAAHDNLLLWAVHPFNYVTFGGLIFE